MSNQSTGMRGYKNGRNADIIVVSSVGTQTQLKAAIEAGANDFIQKPLNAEQIHHIISSRFEGR